MAILATCPKCKQKHKIGDDAAGKRIKCSGCGTVFATQRPAAPGPQKKEAKPEQPAFKRCACPSCNAGLKLPASVPAGKRLACPQCSKPFTVPGEEEEAAAVTTAPSRTAADLVSARRGGAAGAKARARFEPPEESFEDEEERDFEEEDEEPAPRRKRAGKRGSRRGAEEPGKISAALRVSVLILGLLGGLLSGALGLKWLTDARSPEIKAMRELAAAIAKESGSKELQDGLARLDRLATSSYFLLLATPLGIAGGVLALRGRGKLGGGLMLAAVPVPLILSLVTLMPLYFLLVGGGIALLMKPWSPDGGPSRAAVGWMTAGGWLVVLIGWVVVVLCLPQAVPELDAAPSAKDQPKQSGSPLTPPIVKPGVPNLDPGAGPVAPNGGQPARGNRIQVALGMEGYPAVTKKGVKVGQKIKVKGNLFADDGGHISLSLAELYNGPAPAVSAAELIRVLGKEPAAADAFRQGDGLTIVEGVVAELHPESFSLSLEGAKK